MPPRKLSPLGELLERARTDILHISAREAARRAGISEGWWRQVVTGVHRTSGGDVAVKATAPVVVSMALAVEVDPAAAVEAAGLTVSPEGLAALIAAARRPRTAAPATADEVAAEIHRIDSLNLDATVKWRLIQPLYNLLHDLHHQDQGGALKRGGI